MSDVGVLIVLDDRTILLKGGIEYRLLNVGLDVSIDYLKDKMKELDAIRSD
jgi:hypothetical protein